jgi:transposase
MKHSGPGSPLLPGKVLDPGGRDLTTGCSWGLWVLRSGAHWQELPERYGKWKTVHRRLSQCAAAVVWEKIFADLVADRDNQYLMLDSPLGGLTRSR